MSGRTVLPVRFTVAFALATTAMAGCGQESGDPTTTVASPPDAVVREWLDAVDSGDVETLRGVVAGESLAFVVGIESRLDTDEVVALVDAGFPDAVVARYWTSFAESFAAIDGTDVAELEVGSVDEFEVGGARFAAVTVGTGERSTDVLVRRDPDGTWRVDMLATVGGGLTVQLADIASQATADRVRTLFEQWVLPGLEAAARNDTEGVLVEAVRDVRLAFDGARP